MFSFHSTFVDLNTSNCIENLWCPIGRQPRESEPHANAAKKDLDNYKKKIEKYKSEKWRLGV